MENTVTTNMGMEIGPVTMDKRKFQKRIMSLSQGNKKFLAFSIILRAFSSLFMIMVGLSGVY